MSVLVRIVQRWSNSILSETWIGVRSNFTTWNSVWHWFRYNNEVPMCFWAIEHSLCIRWFRMALKFQRLEVCSRSRIFYIGWRLINAWARSSRTESIYFRSKWIVWLIMNWLNYLNFLGSICAWSWVLTQSVSFISFKNSVEGSDSTFKKTLRNLLITILWAPSGSSQRCRCQVQSWEAI